MHPRSAPSPRTTLPARKACSSRRKSHFAQGEEGGGSRIHRAMYNSPTVLASITRHGLHGGDRPVMTADLGDAGAARVEKGGGGGGGPGRERLAHAS